MQAYSQYQEDNDRVKRYPESLERVFLPWPVDALSLEGKADARDSKAVLDLDDISALAAMALAKVAEVPVSWRGVPLIFRTSPSGGSRHPTEGYLIALEIAGLQQGTYHIQSDPICLTQLSTQLPDELAEAFWEFYSRDGNIPAAIIFLISVFKRNMFRYREPRTFRTVHMDAGHVLGTLELVAQRLNIQSVVFHQIDEKRIKAWLGLDGMSEGVITSVAFFNSKESRHYG